MIKNLTYNWKTTSVGLGMILGSIIHLVFAVTGHTATEGVWTASASAIIGGIGLLAAGDASKSQTKDDAAKVQIQTAVAIKTGDTSILTGPITAKDSEPKT